MEPLQQRFLLAINVSSDSTCNKHGGLESILFVALGRQTISIAVAMDFYKQDKTNTYPTTSSYQSPAVATLVQYEPGQP